MALLVVLKAFVVAISFHLLFNMVMVKCNETSETYCPSRGKAANGKWRLNEKDGLRCILDCDTAYSPNGCHILRQDGYGDWNHNITRCEEESWLNKKKVACFTAIAGIIAASPWIFGALGFSTIGIVAGSLAAKCMAAIVYFTPILSYNSYIIKIYSPKGIVSARSLFAGLQSLGMTGISWTAFLQLISIAGGACDGLIDFFSETPCEVE